MLALPFSSPFVRLFCMHQSLWTGNLWWIRFLPVILKILLQKRWVLFTLTKLVLHFYVRELSDNWVLFHFQSPDAYEKASKSLKVSIKCLYPKIQRSELGCRWCAGSRRFQRQRSPRKVLAAKYARETMFRIWAFAWACKLQWLNLHVLSWSWMVPTTQNSIQQQKHHALFSFLR